MPLAQLLVLNSGFEHLAGHESIGPSYMELALIEELEQEKREKAAAQS